MPEGNTTTYTFNENSTDRFQHGNLIREVREPDGARGGDQPKIELVYVYEPIYNRPCLIVFPRGADMNNNGFTPPISDPASRTMVDPYDGTKNLNLRYAKVHFFDFQESPEKASQAPASRKDKDGSGGQVNQSPLIGVDPNVLTTEVWLIQILQLSEDSTGLTELRGRLSMNLTSLGLGDLNGDGDTTPASAGNIIRTAYGSPVLLANANQHKLEADIETAGDLIDQTKTYQQGGTNEGSHGNRLQTIVWMYQYNKFGQMARMISPEGNVTTYLYNSENNPDGDTTTTPAPADGRTLDAVTGGYLKEILDDANRSYFQQTTGTPLTGTFSNNNTDPPVTDIKGAYSYDDVGNVTRMIDGRGLRIDFFVNELNEVVQSIRAADISAAATANPPDPLYNHPDPNQRLTAFAYKSQVFIDFNGNRVLSQVEDRGNTTSVDGSGLGVLPAQATQTTPELTGADTAGGEAYADSLFLYDRLNDLIETRREVDGTRNLNTRYRYNGNQRQVLVIYPEGNAESSVYDERELLFQLTQGASSRPTAGKYATGDPVSFVRPGGAGTESSTFTFNYDKNQNLTEAIDAVSHGGTGSTISGVGDAMKWTFDGFDRQKVLTDPLGNRIVFLYDPDSNLVRTIEDGDPIDDIAGAGENKTLAVTEMIHDELARGIVLHRVLFRTPDAAPSRIPTLTDTPSMDTLAAYLADTPSDTALVPGTMGITVVGRVTTITEYDRESRATFAIQDDLDTTRAGYDGASRFIELEDSAKSNGFSGTSFDPANLDGNIVCVAYDDNSNSIEVKETDVTSILGVPSEEFRTTTLYDSVDRRQTTFDNRGQATDFRHDSRSNLVAMADALSPTVDEQGRTFNRRGCGSTVAVTLNKLGNVMRRRYDGARRVLERESILTATGKGDGINIGATLEGVLTSTPAPDPAQSGDGLISTYYAYDDNSQLLALRDDDGNTAAYVYDNQNRTKCELRGQAFFGTAFGPIVCPRSGLTGDTGSFNVALRGGVTPVDTEPAGTDIDFAYDKDSNLTSLTDEAGNIFNYTVSGNYDALNRRKSCRITRAAGFVGTTKQTWKYDGLSRMTDCTDNNEEPDNDPDTAPFDTTDDVLSKYFFDSLSRKVEEQQQIGSLSSKAVSCSYNIDCSCASVALPSWCIYPDGRQVDNDYDRLDRLVSRRDNGQSIDIGKYEYIGPWRVAALTYQNKVRLTHLNGTNDVGFDTLRRVTSHRWESFTTQALGQGTRVLQFEYQDGSGNPLYDRANNKRIEHKDHDVPNSEQYKYDSVYRLTSPGSGSQGSNSRGFERGTFADSTRTSMSTVAFFQDWDLEGVGNWTRHDDNARLETRTHSDFNEIVDRVVSASVSTLTHDKNGNATDTGFNMLGGQSFPGGGLRIEFDAFNRVKKVWNNQNTPGTTGDDVVKAEYNYDCNHRRMRKRLPGPNNQLDAYGNGNDDLATDFYYEGWRVLEEREPVLTTNPPTQDAITQQYTYGIYLDEAWTLDNRRSGITIAQLNDLTGNQRHFYTANTLYHVYGLTDEAGGLKEAYQYDAYGKQTVITDGPDGDSVVNFTADDMRSVGGTSMINGSPYMYTGQRFDSETGLMYYKTRYSSRELGRFISRDAVGYATTLGLYEYVNSRPTFYFDPFGLQVVSGSGFRNPVQEGAYSSPQGAPASGGPQGAPASGAQQEGPAYSKEYPAIPKEKETPEALKEFNCGGLAMRTYKNVKQPEAVQRMTQHCTEIDCKKECDCDKLKCWLWVYNYLLLDPGQEPQKGVQATQDYHMVCGLSAGKPGECSVKRVDAKEGPAPIKKNVEPAKQKPSQREPQLDEQGKKTGKDVVRNVFFEKCYCCPTDVGTKPLK